MITIETEGFNGFAALLETASKDVSEKTAQALVKTGFALHGDLLLSLSQAEAETGIKYTRGGVTHTASAPGDPPAWDTGTYSGSWGVDESKARQGEVSVFTNDQRAPWLEFGTLNMAPRPHLGPAVERIRPIFDKSLNDAMGDTLEGK